LLVHEILEDFEVLIPNLRIDGKETSVPSDLDLPETIPLRLLLGLAELNDIF